MHSPTYCHNLVVHDLANWEKPDNINLYHYIDDLLLKSDSLEAVGQAAGLLTAYLQKRGWAINPQKVQGPGLSEIPGSSLTKDKNMACILPRKADLPLLVPLKHLYYSP